MPTALTPELPSGVIALRSADRIQLAAATLIGRYALVRLGRLTGAMFVALGSGCGGTKCNDVGCSTGILVESADLFAIEDLPLSVTVCADEVWNTQRIHSSDVDAGQRLVHLYSMVDFDAEHERDVSVTLEVRSERTGDVLADADGTAHLKRLQPNGASCGPTCYFAQLRYDGTNKLLPA